MKKWIGSALVYLLIVIGGYTAYSYFVAEDSAYNEVGHGEHESIEKGEDHSHGDAHDNESDSEVTADVEISGETLTVKLIDNQGNPMDDLEVNHEKLVHLILISEDLEIFRHLHPEKIDPGVFNVDANLEEGMYQAFVDIKPSELPYMIKPHPLMVGDHGTHGDAHAHLHPDTEWTKEQNGYSVTLEVDNFSVKDNVVLSFNIEGAEPEPYLGALGHVVVVNETLEEFIHVHPRAGEAPVFEAHFSKPGMYKLWAEFKLNGEVYAFPYVLEITE
ncbi:hypothetical protein [Sutcliffiella rhizosphaerae]|uniref:Secreted protein n=1 Tax=Sutcliffiella rhizosphaerae TaxID=2880967 RepID=A0ABM8YPV4_9BACI|nr:hypothetical protein [Sutcliffiella rhizosphaerae]CAG9622042.1 hypothetical protein BACCIP111883_02833 [Sutcliffiella rhizosphaerae]